MTGKPEPGHLYGLWQEQLRQQGHWHDLKNITLAERESLVKELLLGLHEETGELQRLLDRSKYHILKGREVASLSTESVAEAGVDVFKYLSALMLLHGVGWQDFTEAFWRKSAVVEQRWLWERDDLTGLTTLLCDMDDCIADWQGAFVAYGARHGHEVNARTVNQPAMEELKDQFYAGGEFLRLAPIHGAIDVLNRWRAKTDRRRLVIVTARPFKRHPRVYADTLEWCQREGLRHDHILFQRDKAASILDVAPSRVVAFIEDRAKHCIEVAATGTSVFKLPNPMGEETVDHPLIHEVADWTALERLLEAL